MGIRIGGASAFYGDSQLAARQLVDHGNVDYLIFDYLAEVTMAILARSAAKNPQLGYAVDFVDVAMRDVLADCANKGIKVIANAGGVNVGACVAALEKLCKEQAVDLKIAGISGDDLGEIHQDLDLPEVQSGQPLPPRLASINAYFGAAPIRDALQAGADIVVTGRVVDSALVLGPLMYEHGWSETEYHHLAQGSLCGHIIECGAQCTGGNFTDWQDVPDFDNIGYPIAEVENDGSFTIGLPDGAGGLVTPETVGEQLLYEIGDPANYLLPDVACDFSNVLLTQEQANLVRVSGATGRAPGNQYKVCATWVDGFRLLGSFYMAGPRSAQKAESSLQAWVKRTRKVFDEKGWGDYRRVSIEFVGAESIYGPHSRQQDTREVMGKFGLHHDNIEALKFAAMEMAYLATSGPPAMSGFAAGRARPQPLMRVHSAMIDKDQVPVVVQLGDKILSSKTYLSEGSDANGSPPPNTIPAAVKKDDMIRISLEQLAVARSGDKGDNANIGVISRKPDYLPYINEQLTEAAVSDYFSHLINGKVTRFYVPGLDAFNFLMTEALGGGGTASIRLDSQAKTYAQMLLSFEIEVPAELIAG